MKELSVFIDESGDFGEYNDQSPYYIITMVFHDQSILIEEEIHKLDQELSYMNLGGLCIHTGPIIRREEIYEYMSIKERRRTVELVRHYWNMHMKQQEIKDASA